jgi:hypothetical protein
MAFFARGIEIGANQQYDRVEFSLGHSHMASLRGALVEDMIGIAVQCAGASGKIVFELPHPISLRLGSRRKKNTV